MIERIEFRNFKALRSAALPVGPFTLIVGPNASGKSTALSAVNLIREYGKLPQSKSAMADKVDNVDVTIRWGDPDHGCCSRASWSPDSTPRFDNLDGNGNEITGGEPLLRIRNSLMMSRVYALDAEQIAKDVQLIPNMQFESSGFGLAAVLDRLRDGSPERFDALGQELPNWFPEYDTILFEVPSDGMRRVALRTRKGGRILSRDLSQGTLLALVMLTLAYLPEPPPVIGFEEPDRGIHPRLLREIRDALYRLSYPESAGDARPPVQVIATTHSPYFLDLFKDHPEEIVIAEKHGADATFEKLTDRPDIEQILDGASLGDVWYSGILGGVPVAP
jgi:predicted ATPase